MVAKFREACVCNGKHIAHRSEALSGLQENSKIIIRVSENFIVKFLAYFQKYKYYKYFVR